jgi:hypothetical protein
MSYGCRKVCTYRNYSVKKQIRHFWGFFCNTPRTENCYSWNALCGIMVARSVTE